jgi:hypothetical protein
VLMTSAEFSTRVARVKDVKGGTFALLGFLPTARTARTAR